MTIEHRIAHLASQLLGDLNAVDSLMCPSQGEADQQRLQLIVEAFERVSELTLQLQGEEWSSANQLSEPVRM